MRTTVIVAAAVSLSVASSALAGRVWINSNQVQNFVETGSVGQAKYRLSQNNFDMSLDRGQGTNPGQFQSLNLGNNNALSGRTFDFTLRHIAGEGLIFTMLNTVSRSSSTLAWGSFTTPPSGSVFTTIGGAEPAATDNPDANRRSFNALILTATSTRNNSSMTFSNLAFTSGLSLQDGALFGGAASTPGTGNIAQRVVSDTNLASIDWTLTGSLTGSRDNSAGGDETVKFTIAEKIASFRVVVIPAANPLTMSTAGLALVAGMGMCPRRRGRVN